MWNSNISLSGLILHLHTAHPRDTSQVRGLEFAFECLSATISLMFTTIWKMELHSLPHRSSIHERCEACVTSDTQVIRGFLIQAFNALDSPIQHLYASKKKRSKNIYKLTLCLSITKDPGWQFAFLKQRKAFWFFCTYSQIWCSLLYAGIREFGILYLTTTI
jgi:hypothetical protein